MDRELIGLADLATIEDGALDRVLQDALRRVQDDLRGRPGLERARTVTLRVRLTPRSDEAGRVLRGAHLAYDVKSALPPASVETVLKADQGVLFYDDGSEDDDRGSAPNLAAAKPTGSERRIG